MALSPQSQRDWRWSWKKLGFSSTTIGGYGCVDTCLAMIHGCRPDEMNEMLKGGGAFTNGNQVNWTSLHGAVPAFSFLPGGLVNHYNDPTVDPTDNAIVLNHIAKYGFCLVRVDATPIGSPRNDHFVIFVGNHQLLDPWDGKRKPTSTYSATGYRLVAHV